MNSMKKRLSVYLEEGINQMVGDIPRPLLFNKLNQEVMWRTESKLALVAIALIVLGGIYVCQTRVTIERQMPSLYSWRMEKLIVTIMYCSIPPMMSRWIKEH
jgi:hypothetical protein